MPTQNLTLKIRNAIFTSPGTTWEATPDSWQIDSATTTPLTAGSSMGGLIWAGRRAYGALYPTLIASEISSPIADGDASIVFLDVPTYAGIIDGLPEWRINVEVTTPEYF